MLHPLRARISIIWLATAATLTPLLTLAALLLWMSERSSARTREALGRQVIDASTRRIEESVMNNVEQTRGLSDLLTMLIQDGTIAPDDSSRWRPRLFAHLRGSPEVTGIVFVNSLLRSEFVGRFVDDMEYGMSDPASGKLETYAATPDGKIDTSSKLTIDYDVRQRPFYKVAMQSDRPAWTPVYRWIMSEKRHAASEWSVGYTRVIRRLQATTTEGGSATKPSDADILGVLCVDLSLSHLSAFLSRVAEPLHATMFISDTDDHLLGASNPSRMKGPSALTDFGDPVERTLAHRLSEAHQTSTSRPVDDEAAVTTLDIAGKPYWTKQKLIRASPSESWYLTMAIPQEAILGGVNAEASTIWIASLGCIAIAGIGAAVLARMMSRPFRELAAFAEKLGQGHLDRRIDVRAAREVAQLGGALNAMAAKLSDHVVLRTNTDAAIEGNAFKARLIAHMSHEFRTPLNAIIGYAELMDEAARVESRPRDAADASGILIASNHLLSLVENLLDLSAIEAGRFRLESIEFAIGALLEEVANSCRPVVERNRNRLRIIAPAANARMTSDPTRVRQILINLVGNAGKFTAGGTVTISAELDAIAMRVRLIVADTGPGIPAAGLAGLFEPFASSVIAGPGNTGPGLGLAISQQLAYALAGTITVITGSEGTTMTLDLPLAALPSTLSQISNKN